MNNSKELTIESRLRELADILYNQLCIKTPFDDLNKSIKIIEQRNQKQYSSIDKKIKKLSMILYQTGVMHSNKEIALEINKKLDDIYTLLIQNKQNY